MNDITKVVNCTREPYDIYIGRPYNGKPLPEFGTWTLFTSEILLF